jgi:acetylglutamate kinase
VSAVQRALGLETAFIGGRRVTSKADIDLLRMVLSGLVNKRLVNGLVAAGVPAVGLSGEDCALINAEVIDTASLGLAGRPTSINVQVLRTLMTAGNLAVISPVAYDGKSAEGGALNVNGDDAAAAIAIALGVTELVLVADVEGVLGKHGDLMQELSLDSALDLVETGIATAGMAAKLESARVALRSGVERVRICDLTGVVDRERGTLITQSQSVAI